MSLLQAFLFLLRVLRTASTSEMLSHTGKRKAVKLLRLPLYKDLACPKFTTPSPLSMSTVPRASSVMQRAALCWFHTPRGMFIPNAPMRCALRIRLTLPLLRPTLTCQYTPATSQGLCGHPLDVFATHCHTCARGPIKYRHDAVKAAWANLLRQAGWHVTIEQTVTLATEGSQPTKKADLVTISPGGATYALDVIVTHGAPNSNVRQALQAAEADTCRQYRVHHAGALLPGEGKFLPLVHHHTGMLF
eukprot:60159-Amphidinium_carterae.2